MKKIRISKLTVLCAGIMLVCGLMACKDAYSADIISGEDHNNEEAAMQGESVGDDADTETPGTEEITASTPLEAVAPEAEKTEAAAELPELAESGAAQCEPVSPEAPSKALIDSYGYEEDGKSVLSYDIRPGEVIDGGDHYEVTAIYAQAIQVPTDLQVGDSVTLVFNEMTGEEKTLTLQRERSFLDEDGMDYYYWPTEEGPFADLYWFSDDRVDKPVCEEKLYIRKFATSENIIGETVELITEEMLANGAWYNGVYFDELGYVTRLCFIGD